MVNNDLDEKHTDNYRIKAAMDARPFAGGEQALEKVSLKFREDNHPLNIRWLNGNGSEPYFSYHYDEQTKDSGGHARGLIGHNGFKDKDYKSEFWNDSDSGAQSATSRHTLETGKILEKKYYISSAKSSEAAVHFYAERSYVMDEAGRGLETHYNISDLKNGMAVSFTTDGKGNIDAKSLKERKLSADEIENITALGDNHYEEVKGFYEHNDKKNKEKNLDNKNGYVEPTKSSDRVGMTNLYPRAVEIAHALNGPIIAVPEAKPEKLNRDVSLFESIQNEEVLLGGMKLAVDDSKPQGAPAGARPNSSKSMDV